MVDSLWVSKKVWRNAAGGALVLAGCSAAWELVWSTLIPPQHSKLVEIVFGTLHGASVLASLGGYLGWLHRKPLRGAALGLLWGGLAAASFYLASPLAMFGLVGILSAFFISWLVFWIGISASWQQLSESSKELGLILRNGALAAIAAAPGFAGVLFLWTHRSLNYELALSFGAWFLATLPGLVLVLRKND